MAPATEILVVATIADKTATEGIALEASTPLNLGRMLHINILITLPPYKS
jgi:hypothetical protein